MFKCPIHGNQDIYEGPAGLGSKQNRYCKVCRRNKKATGDRRGAAVEPVSDPDEGIDILAEMVRDLTSADIERATLLYASGEAKTICRRYDVPATDLADALEINVGTARRWLAGNKPQTGLRAFAAAWLLGIEAHTKADFRFLELHGYPASKYGARQHTKDSTPEAGPCGGLDNGCPKCKRYFAEIA